jgi:hypothetical protein
MLSKVKEEIPLLANTQQRITESLEVVMPALEGRDAENHQTNQPPSKLTTGDELGEEGVSVIGSV